MRISKKKKRNHNGQKKKYKRTNNDLQNIHIKLKIEEGLVVPAPQVAPNLFWLRNIVNLKQLNTNQSIIVFNDENKLQR